MLSKFPVAILFIALSTFQSAYADGELCGRNYIENGNQVSVTGSKSDLRAEVRGHEILVVDPKKAKVVSRTKVGPVEKFAVVKETTLAMGIYEQEVLLGVVANGNVLSIYSLTDNEKLFSQTFLKPISNIQISKKSRVLTSGGLDFENKYWAIQISVTGVLGNYIYTFDDGELELVSAPDSIREKGEVLASSAAFELKIVKGIGYLYLVESSGQFIGHIADFQQNDEISHQFGIMMDTSKVTSVMVSGEKESSLKVVNNKDASVWKELDVKGRVKSYRLVELSTVEDGFETSETHVALTVKNKLKVFNIQGDSPVEVLSKTFSKGLEIMEIKKEKRIVQSPSGFRYEAIVVVAVLRDDKGTHTVDLESN